MAGTFCDVTELAETRHRARKSGSNQAAVGDFLAPETGPWPSGAPSPWGVPEGTTVHRSITRWLFGLAFRALAIVFGLVLLLAIIRPLLTILACLAIVVMVVTAWVRWRLFRHRDW